MWFLVSVSVLTCAVAGACLGPRKGEVHMGGIELPRSHVTRQRWRIWNRPP